MRLTSRCINLLKLLRTARWLTTAQIHRRFFLLATADAARKRLRKLTSGGYLVAVRRDRMSQVIFTIGPEGKRVLEMLGGDVVTVDRKPPIQREHFLAINDLRISAELTGSLKFFFAAWELPGLGWKDSLIPDGVLAFENKTFAIEFDRGVEGVQFFVRTKMGRYQRGLVSLSLDAVLIVADRSARMLSLAKAIGDVGGKVMFTTLDQIVTRGFSAPVFYTESAGWGVSLFENLSCQALSPTRDFSVSNCLHISNLGFLKPDLLRQEGVEHGKGSDQ